MNLGSLDLNLLLVYRALMIHRSVTLAGEEVGLSQPAISHALTRLRHYYKDPLFLRTRDGMEPTPRARELAVPVQEALSRIELTLPGLKNLTQDTKRCFRVGLVNYSGLPLVPKLAAILERKAPGFELDTVHVDGPSCLAKLQRAELDLGVGIFARIPADWPVQALWVDRLVVAMRRKHPRITGRLTLEAFAKERHVRVASNLVVDDALAKKGLSRRFALSANMLMVPFVLARTNLLAILPHRLVRRFHRTCDLQWFDPPMELPVYRVMMVRHPHSSGDPVLDWLAQTAAEVSKMFGEH